MHLAEDQGGCGVREVAGRSREWTWVHVEDIFIWLAPCTEYVSVPGKCGQSNGPTCCLVCAQHKYDSYKAKAIQMPAIEHIFLQQASQTG